MAANIDRDFDKAYLLSVACSNPTTPASGDPVRFGNLTGIALGDESEAISGETAVNFGPFIADVSVKGIDDSGNSAVAKGDSIFYVDADTPKLSKKASGYFFGFALETINSGSTDTIKVFHPPAGAWVGTVNTGDLAAGAVTAAKLATSLKTKVVPIPLSVWREVASNDIQALAAHGGIMAKDSTPIFEFTNGDTDSALRLRWAATVVDAIVAQVPLPDVDEAAVVEVHVLAAMSDANDTPVISADSYFNVGDTKVEDDSAAITGTTVTEYIITIAAADVPAGAQTLTVELTPGAHGTDALYVYATWLEYTRV